MIDYHLERFLLAQKKYYETALAELQAGQKRSHWIWFIFPQIDGLGQSEISRRFAITSIEEAQAYLEHPILGMRLCECVQAVLDINNLTATEIFGTPDNKRFLSSLTLFSELDNERSFLFVQVISQYFHGIKDRKTLELI